MKNLLSQADYENWSIALDALPDDPENLMDWVEGPLRVFLSFKSIYCAYAEITLGQIKVLESISSGHDKRRKFRIFLFWNSQRLTVFDASLLALTH